jgi:hypothetical protein
MAVIGFDWQAFMHEYRNEGDRAAAILSVVPVDKFLEALIREYFVPDDGVVDDLLKDGQPLGSFSTRLKTAFVLGFVAKTEFRDLNIIRKIRNEFAHDPPGLSFASRSVADRCHALGIVDAVFSPPRGPVVEYLKDPRYRYGTTCMMVTGRLENRISRLRREGPKVVVLPEDLARL